MKATQGYLMKLHMSWQRLDACIYMVDERDQSFYFFDGSAYEILKCIIYDQYSFDKIVEELSKAYCVNREELSNDIREFINQLEFNDIIERVEQ